MLKIKAMESKKTELFLLTAISAVFVFLCFYASPYVRGSDQYWHITNIKSILGGTFSSNEYYPSMIFNPEWNGQPMPFIHNTPVMYIWAAFAAVIGHPETAAVTVNILFSLATALILKKAVGNITGGKYSLFAFALFLLFPLTYWQTSQILVEVSAMFFISAALYIAFFKTNLRWGALAAVLAVIALVSREHVAFFAIAVFVLIFIKCDVAGRKKWPHYLAIVLFSLTLFVLEGKLMPEATSAFGKSFMEGLYAVSVFYVHYYETPAVTAVITEGSLLLNFVNKIPRMFGKAFSLSMYNLLFSYPFFMALIMGMAISIRGVIRKQKYFFRLFAVFFLVALTIFATSIYFQFQVRYTIVFIPLLIAAILMAAEKSSSIKAILEKRRKLAAAVVSVLLVGLAGMNTMLAINARKETISENNFVSGIEHKLKNYIGEEDTILCLSNDSMPPLLAYLAYPSKIIQIDFGLDEEIYQSKENNDISDMLVKLEKNNLTPQWILCENNANESRAYKQIEQTYSLQFKETAEEFSLYECVRK